MKTYAPAPMTFVRGEGTFLWDSDGNKYLDCVAGIAVISVGHCNPSVVTAIQQQSATLMHVSNLYKTEQAYLLADNIQQTCDSDTSVFFANSGAEANECAIKLARKWAGDGRYKVISAERSFHGRSLATLAATGQPAKWKGFEPLPDGFLHAEFNNAASFEECIDEEVAAILVEPIQGEGGIIPGEKAFLSDLRAMCSQHNIALIFDEVQSGMARTGHWWAFQQYGVTPDIFTSAKGLGNGVPIGACIALNADMQNTFQPGDHATTFGGGPVICAAANATINFMRDNEVLKNVQRRSAQLKRGLEQISGVQSVRGHGLMLGVVLTADKAKECAETALSKGLLLNAPIPNVIRVVPPLTISESEVQSVLDTLGEVITTIVA
jgi:predicted acetylornithine/succinylornithine family transaminase